MSVAAVAVIAVLNIATAPSRIRPAPLPLAGQPVDAAVASEARWAEVRAWFAHAGITGRIGYLDQHAGLPAPEEPRRTMEYFLAEYALAPLVVEPLGAEHHWAVLHLPDAKEVVAPPEGWAVAQAFGPDRHVLKRSHR